MERIHVSLSQSVRPNIYSIYYAHRQFVYFPQYQTFENVWAPRLRWARFSSRRTSDPVMTTMMTTKTTHASNMNCIYIPPSRQQREAIFLVLPLLPAAVVAIATCTIVCRHRRPSTGTICPRQKSRRLVGKVGTTPPVRIITMPMMMEMCIYCVGGMILGEV